MTKAVAVLAGAVSAAALAAGCGSSRLSHDAFVERANAICASYERAIERLRKPRTLTDIERYSDRVLPIYRRALGELGKLQPSKRDEPSVRAWLRVDRAIARDLVGLGAAAHARRIPRVRDVVRRAQGDNRRSNRLARRLGLSVCARA